MNDLLKQLISDTEHLPRVEPPLLPDTGLVALSGAHDGEVPEHLSQFPFLPFQRAGVQYALRQRRVIIGDEQGLGKTIQGVAVATHAVHEGHKAVVVVPPSLRLNWQREFARWAPHVSTAIITGRFDKDKSRLPKADVFIVGDSTIQGWHTLLNGKVSALIIDEAHRAKNPKAQRSLALRGLAQSIGSDGYVVCLSGTIVINRPVELINPLHIINRLQPVFGNESAFKFRYCNPVHNGFGYSYNGSSNEVELHDLLVGTCYVRRRKIDVLTELPAKRRARIDVGMDSASLREYRRVENDFLAWVLESGGREAVLRASRAEVITKLNALRQLLGVGKVEAVVDQCRSLLEAGEQVVVFAHHKRVISALREALSAEYPTVVVAGGVSNDAKQKAVDDFQSGDVKVFIGQFESAGVGLTLTKASNVVIAELPWSPSVLAQAEDRCYRIGQQDSVTAWSLLCADAGTNSPTVDERLWSVLNAKQEVVSSILDGWGEDLGAESVDGSVINALLEGWLG